MTCGEHGCLAVAPTCRTGGRGHYEDKHLELVAHECGGHDVALVVPVVAVGHQQAPADKVLGALLLQPRLAGGVGVLGGQQFLDHVRLNQAHPRLAAAPEDEPFAYAHHHKKQQHQSRC